MNEIATQAKTIEDHFNDWESHVFGFGYGTGEPHTIPALKKFLELCDEGDPPGRMYNYERLEAALTPTVAWLLINALCKADIIEYGTSPRFAWLTEQGEALKSFVANKTDDELIELSCRDSDYIGCYPDHCNCDDPETCRNPFWKARKRTTNQRL